jgi:hypothetical protein
LALRIGQQFAWSPPEWVFCTTSLCQSAGRYPLPMGSSLNLAVAYFGFLTDPVY